MKNLLYQKKVDKFDISLTVHKCPKYMFNEIYPIFKTIYLKIYSNILKVL